MPNALKISGLPSYLSGVKQVAGLLLAAGYDKEATTYMLTAEQFAASGLTLSGLSLLLTTGLPQTSTQKGILHNYSKSTRDNSVSFTLNYNLEP